MPDVAEPRRARSARGKGTPARHADRAAFYLCLARAFLPPRESTDYDAFKLHLCDDLDALCAALGHGVTGDLRELRAAVARVPGHLALLQAYSRLFVAPPAPAPLNAGLYLDGAVMGAATAALEKCYRDCGLAPGGRFHDLPDHVALQLEFTAHLCAAEANGTPLAHRADDFLSAFVRCWLPPFLASLERACEQSGPGDIYLWLGRLLQGAVDHELRDVSPARVRPALAADAAPVAGRPV